MTTTANDGTITINSVEAHKLVERAQLVDDNCDIFHGDLTYVAAMDGRPYIFTLYHNGDFRTMEHRGNRKVRLYPAVLVTRKVWTRRDDATPEELAEAAEEDHP